jgi:23S rRNA (cytosine1962-C5)-methyltransferase
MILKRLGTALVLDKPAGVATHTPDGGVTEGFLEMASRLLETPLWAVHRLDRDTSGCLLVSLTDKAVDQWTKALANGKKKYIFVSPLKSKEAVWSYEGRIEKIGNHRFGLIAGENNSQTSFAKLGPCDLGYLYQAEISTGKTHQIRIHAQACGIPILGDSEHGGEPFSRLMLHARELELDKEKAFSPDPQIFKIAKNSEDFDDLAKFLISMDRRRFLFQLQSDNNAFRLVHRDWATGKGPRLVIEKLGDVLQVLSYFGRDPDRKFLDQICHLAHCKYWFLRKMNDRGKDTGTENIKVTSENLPLQWNIKENKVLYDLRYSQGLSSGLFLDQRANRERILKNTQGKSVANFFSYTCGFSVAAALGGAHEVVSIDTSSNSLEWGKNNFRLNGLDPDKFEFFTADSLFFLQSCLKRQRKFDIIILDPPTFSRNKNGVFKIADDLPKLLEMAFMCLERSGTLLVTVNDETMTFESLSEKIENAALKTKSSPMKMEKIRAPYDFEFPQEKNSVMKGFWVSKL